MLGRGLAVLCLAALAVAGPGYAAPAQPEPRSPEAFRALTACRSIAEDAARLACFDQTVSALETAARQRDIVVVDREQVRATRRSLFGFTLPSLRIFGSGGDDRQEDDEIKEIEAKVASATQDRDGRWLLTLDEHGTWRQMDSTPVAIWPKRGSTVVIRKAALTSYFMRIDRQPGIRVRREN